MTQQEHLQQFKSDLRDLMERYGVVSIIPKTTTRVMRDESGFPIIQTMVLPGQFECGLKSDWQPVTKSACADFEDE